jgi:hypothetical protein
MAKEGTGATTARPNSRTITVTSIRRKGTCFMTASQGYVLINSVAGIPIQPDVQTRVNNFLEHTTTLASAPGTD